MLNTTMLKRFLTGFLVILASQLMLNNTYASSSFPVDAIKVGVQGITCTTCHATMAGGSNAIKTDACTTAFRSNRDYKALQTCVTAATPSVKACKSPYVSSGNTCVLATTKKSSIGLANSGAAKTDVWTVTCPGTSNSLSVAIQDLAPVKTPIISIQATKSGASSILSSDKGKDGDVIYSPLVKLAKGAGVYTVKINKPAYTGAVAANKGAELYNALFYCQNKAGSKVVNGPLKNTQNQ